MNELFLLHMNHSKFEQELLDLHKQVGDAYLNKNIGFFTENIASDYFSISRGKLIKPSKDKIIYTFSNYLNSTEFKVYENIIEPIVKISDDGTLGWVVAQVKIQAERKMDVLSKEIDETWTWITLYKRENGIWIRLGEVNSMNST